MGDCCFAAWQIVFGCQDGKVRLAQLKTAKAVALYSTGSYVVSMCNRCDVVAAICHRLPTTVSCTV